MIRVALKIVSPTALLADLDGFCVAFGYQPFDGLRAVITGDATTDPVIPPAGEAFVHSEVNERLRFDYDFLRAIKPQVLSQPILVSPEQTVTHPAVIDETTGEVITPEFTEVTAPAVYDFTNAGQEIEPEIDRGLHLNVLITPAITPDPDAVRYAAAIEAALLVESQLQGFFGSLPTVVNDAPAPLEGGQVWNTTGSTTLISPAPRKPNRVWS